MGTVIRVDFRSPLRRGPSLPDPFAAAEAVWQVGWATWAGVVRLWALAWLAALDAAEGRGR